MAKANENMPAADAQDAPQGAHEDAGSTGTRPAPETPRNEAQGGARAKSTYGADDFAAAARERFGVPPEAVSAAMKAAGKRRATQAEAELIIGDFLKREVK
jgi:hypothetical protein